MSAPWIAAFAVLWLAVVVLTFTMIGILRRVSGVLEGVERWMTTPAEFGASVGSTISPFDLVEADDRRVAFDEFVVEPTVVLIASTQCPACATLIRQLEGAGSAIDGVPVVVATNAADPETPYPAELRVLYDPDGAATKALANRATPQAYVLDSTGLVLDRRVPGTLADLEEMAREQRRRAENGSGAASDQLVLAQGT
jgi:hypothetical protein